MEASHTLLSGIPDTLSKCITNLTPSDFLVTMFHNLKMGHVLTRIVGRTLAIRMISENPGHVTNVLLVFQIHCLGDFFYVGGRVEERE